MSYLEKKKVEVKEKTKKIIGYEGIVGGWGFIRSMIHGMLVIVKNSSQKQEVKSETFNVFCLRSHLNEEKLKVLYKNLILQFYLIFVIFLFSIVMLGVNIYNGNWIVSISFFAFFSLCLAMLFKISFRAYQLRLREFVPIKQWLENKKAWLPAFVLPAKVVKKRSVAKKAQE